MQGETAWLRLTLTGSTPGSLCFSPVRPTSPQEDPAGKWKETSRSTGGRPGRYVAVTWRVEKSETDEHPQGAKQKKSEGTWTLTGRGTEESRSEGLTGIVANKGSQRKWVKCGVLTPSQR